MDRHPLGMDRVDRSQGNLGLLTLAQVERGAGSGRIMALAGSDKIQEGRIAARSQIGKGGWDR